MPAPYMSKQQYLAWLRTRGEPGTWDLNKCRAADALIKREAVRAAERKLKACISNHDVWLFTMSMIISHFGSVEVDDLMMKLDAYPEWMDKTEIWL